MLSHPCNFYCGQSRCLLQLKCTLITLNWLFELNMSMNLAKVFQHGATPLPPPRIGILARIALNDSDSTVGRRSMFLTRYLAINVFSSDLVTCCWPEKSSVACFNRVDPSPSLELTLAAFGLGVGLAAATNVGLVCVDVRCFIRLELLEAADVDKIIFPGHSVYDTYTFLALISRREK